MKNYTYNSANRLVQVSDQLSVTSLSYNGLGQRLNMDAAGVIATYVLDGDRPLTATSNSNTTFYLYGLGGIGEETNAWSYSLPDGTKTPRQLSNLQGEVTLSARYTPWGDTLDTFGSGNFTFGYLGGVLDATTGLLYVGNGQYYDPATGRFLTRDVYPNSPNPYVPWNPLGAILGPLALVSLFYTRRKKGSKAGTFLVLVLALGSVGMTLAGCGGGTSTEVTAVVFPDGTATITFGDTTVVANLTPNPGSPLTPLAIPCPTPVGTIAGFPNITMSNPQDWSSAEIAGLTSVLNIMLAVFGNSPSRFANAVGNISVTVVPDHFLTYEGQERLGDSIFGRIRYEHRIFSPLDEFSIIHEFGHQFDWQGHESDAQKLQWRSQQFVDNPAINLNIAQCTDRLQCRNIYIDQNNNRQIYFPTDAYANAFAAYILGPSSPIQYQAEKLTIIQNDIQGVP